ncbi:MAG: protein kinase [Planctomycetota bacterium]|nr:protein kinase [Planctomycetota bacterium]
MAKFKSKLVDDAQDAAALTELLVEQRGEIESIERGASINEERSIFAARDAAIRRTIAVKVLSADDAEKDFKRNRFFQEAQVLGHLEHPNIVPIHDVAKDAVGNLYYSMTLIKGRSLALILREIIEGSGGKVDGVRRRRVIKHQPLNIDHLLDVFLKVCDGISFAHSKSVLHRDLKPASIMVGDYGEVVVMNWGALKVMTDENEIPDEQTLTSIHSETFDGTVLGTPAYMSPEQAEGLPLDPRTDVYSLGAVLYEMLTGVPAFTGKSTNEILLKVIDADFVPPEQRKPSLRIPQELNAIVMKAMAINRDERYSSVPELAGDVRLFLEGREVSAKHDTLGESVAKLVRRNRAVSIASVASFLVLFGLTISFLWDLKKETDRSVRREQDAELGLIKAKRAQSGRRTVEHEAARELAKEAIRSSRSGLFQEAAMRIEMSRRISDTAWGIFAAAINASEQGNEQEAFEYLKTACELDPEHGLSRTYLARVYAKKGENEKVRALLTGLSSENDPDSLQAAGEAFYAIGEYTRALEAWQRSKKFAAQSRHVQVQQIEALEEQILMARAWVSTKGFYESIRELSAKEQFNKVIEKLNELNGTEGKHVSANPVIENDKLIGIIFSAHSPLRFLQPLIGLPLEKLEISAARFLSDLTPLKGMPLEHLSLTSNPEVRDLSPLKGMPLTYLNLGLTGIGDLGPLQGMPLKELHLSRTRANNLSSLAGLPIEILRISGCGIVDLSPLEGMPLLELDASSNDDLRVLAPLSGMPLETLILSNSMNLRNILPLKGLSLKKFVISNSQVKDISPLNGMKLESLDLDSTHVEELSPLMEMPGLLLRPPSLNQLNNASMNFFVAMYRDGRALNTTPELERTQFSDLKLLKGLKQSELHLRSTRVTDLSPLREWDAPIEELDLSDTRIKDLGPLAGLKIRKLMLSNTKIRDLSPLKTAQLKELHLDKTPVTDISPLAGKDIEFLSLADTKVQDLSPLRGMKLEHLNLSSVPATDLSALRGQPVEVLILNQTRFKDLTPLEESPIRSLSLAKANVADMRVFARLPLRSLVLSDT